MICSLSGQEVQTPVVSPKSGAIFEKHLVETYISTTGKDPITDEPLAVSELIPIKSTPAIVPPRPPTFNSIPTMLSAFQNEWDALALETYSLRKQLHSLRQDLSEALYQYDAAVRVAAKAIRERDEAQTALQQLSEAFANGKTEVVNVNENQDVKTSENNVETTDNTLEAIENGVENNDNMITESKVESTEDTKENSEIIALLTSAQQQLFALHKKTKIVLPVVKTLKVEITETSEPLLENTAFVCSDNSSVLLMSPTKIQILGGSSYDIEATFGAFLHDNEKIRPVAVQNSELIDLDSGNRGIDVGSPKFILTHPSEPLFITVDSDKWLLCNETKVVSSTHIEKEVTAAALHVDGVLLGVAVPGSVLIYDLTTGQNVSTISTEHSNINKIQFAMNGYWLLTTSSDKDDTVLEVFDLRKNSLVHLIHLDEPIDYVLDASCSVLATYGKDSHTLKVHLYVKKGKLWVDNAAEITTGALLYLVSESSPQDVHDTKVVKLVGVGEDIHHYSLTVT